MLDLAVTFGAVFVTAYIITVLEMTDVVALVYAFGAGSGSIRPGFFGALSGIACATGGAVVVGLTIVGEPEAAVHAIGTVILWGFGIILLRSTIKSYIREAKASAGIKLAKKVFAPIETLTLRELVLTGFTVGAAETVEAAIPMLVLAAGGASGEVIDGAIAGGLTLLVAGYLLNERIKKVKAPLLKWVATALVCSYGLLYVFDALGEIRAIYWPLYVGPFPIDVVVIPIFIVMFPLIGAIIRLRLDEEGLSWPHVNAAAAPSGSPKTSRRR